MAKEEKVRYEVTEIPTQMSPVIKDNETGTNHDVMTILCSLANDISEIKKNITQ